MTAIYRYYDSSAGIMLKYIQTFHIGHSAAEMTGIQFPMSTILRVKISKLVIHWLPSAAQGANYQTLRAVCLECKIESTKWIHTCDMCKDAVIGGANGLSVLMVHLPRNVTRRELNIRVNELAYK
jgi:hypothetical protein